MMTKNIVAVSRLDETQDYQLNFMESIIAYRPLDKLNLLICFSIRKCLNISLSENMKNIATKICNFHIAAKVGKHIFILSSRTFIQCDKVQRCKA